MDETQDPQQTLTNRPIVDGETVYDVNGDKVGEVSDRGMEAGTLVVRKGLFFPTDLYIPLGAIRSHDAESVHLSVAKEEISSRHWDQPPTEDAAPEAMRLATPINPMMSGGAPVGLSGGAPERDARDELVGADSPETAETANTFTTPRAQP